MTAFLSLALLQAASTPMPIPDLEAARAEVAAKDATLFWAAFEGCTPRSSKSC